jgi:hypothetical protein
MNLPRKTDMNVTSVKPLVLTFAMGGVWDTIAGLLYIFVIGTGRLINNPPIDPFYAVFLGSFFLCFAYLQILQKNRINNYDSTYNDNILFYTIDHSAHSPLIEEPERFMEIMEKDVLQLSKSLAD